MRILTFVRIVTVTFCGLMTGILFGDRMSVSYARRALPASSLIILQQVPHSHYSKILPAFLKLAFAGSVLWLALTVAERWNIHWWLVALAAGAIAFASILTIRVNFPVNDQLMTWNPASPRKISERYGLDGKGSIRSARHSGHAPSCWKSRRSRWEEY